MTGTPSYLDSKEAKYALGANRGPLTEESDDESQDASSKAGDGLVASGKRQRIRRHWKRFWFCYTIGGIVFLAIFLPIFFTIIFQAICQHVIDSASLLLVDASIMQPKPDSVVLTIQTALNLPISLPVRLDSNTLNLFNRDQPGNSTYVKVYSDGQVIHGNTSVGVQNQFTPLNLDPWTYYLRSVMFSPHAPLSAYGETNVHLGKLKSHIKIDKDLPQNTLNSFSGFSIDDPQLILPPRDDGINLISNAILPNPSVMTIEIGTITLDLKSADLTVGNATLENLTLTPGNNSIPLEGVVDFSTILHNIKPILQTQGKNIRQGYLTLDAVGRSVVYDGTEIPYYTELMQSLTLPANVPINELLINSLHGILHGNNSTELSS
ncbi:hypothetical protein BDV59DRAFT_211275 [Aspergillus ambiguus]|uniref:DUF3712 domain-containing protein n=1 Tax=Aspergillus ambiguus TaxID=176160 RepID=UPI003CCD2368